MKKGRDIRRALRDGQFVCSTAVTAPSPLFPAILRDAGVDFAFIDTEHTPLGREVVSWMCQAFAASGVPPVVRVPSPDAVEASKVLDGGAGGVIGPYVETPDQVRALAGACRWRPLKGRRLQEALDDPASLEPQLRHYLEERNADTLLIANIESVPAIERLDAILAVPGLDAVLIGPHDLSCSLGLPEQYDHPRFEEAARTILRTARAHGVGAGIHLWHGVERDLAWVNAGANLIVHAADVSLFRQHLTADIAELRKRVNSAGG